jgi:hypothetical protein
MIKFRVVVAMVVLVIATLSLTAADKPPRIVVTQPTIIAFLAPDPALNEEDANEVLGDFQLYAQQAQALLRQRGIEFHVVDGGEFTVVVGKTVTAFKPAKIKVGYYLIAPGRKPRVEYGVMTDIDLVQVADDYFGTRSY